MADSKMILLIKRFLPCQRSIYGFKNKFTHKDSEISLISQADYEIQCLLTFALALYDVETAKTNI